MVKLIENNTKEIEIVYTSLYRTSKANEFVAEFLTEEDDIFYLVFIYEGSLLDAEAKYSNQKGIFSHLLNSFFCEIARDLILMIRRDNLENTRAAWVGIFRRFSFSF